MLGIVQFQCAHFGREGGEVGAVSGREKTGWWEGGKSKMFIAMFCFLLWICNKKQLFEKNIYIFPNHLPYIPCEYELLSSLCSVKRSNACRCVYIDVERMTLQAAWWAGVSRLSLPPTHTSLGLLFDIMSGSKHCFSSTSKSPATQKPVDASSQCPCGCLQQ